MFTRIARAVRRLVGGRTVREKTAFCLGQMYLMLGEARRRVAAVLEAAAAAWAADDTGRLAPLRAELLARAEAARDRVAASQSRLYVAAEDLVSPTGRDPAAVAVSTVEGLLREMRVQLVALAELRVVEATLARISGPSA